MDSLRRKVTPKNVPSPFPVQEVQIPKVAPLDLPSPEPSHSIPPALPLAQKERVVTPKRFGFFVFGFFLLLLFIFATILWRGLQASEKIQVRGNTIAAPTLTEKLKTLQAALLPGELAPLRGEERGRINVLLLGKAGKNLPGENLTDTIMLASIDTHNKKVALLSLPRDLYVQTEEGANGKINTFYQRGLQEDEPLSLIKEAVTTITGEPVDYFVVLNFSGFEQIVDALGGISVDVPKDFYDPRYPGKNYSYETFELKKGWQRLDGATALKYVRERHDDPEGDFGRAKRQQQVLQAIKNKAASPGTYLNFFKVHKLFESIEQNVETDITLPEMQSFYELSKSLDTQNIANQVVDAWKPESLLRVNHIMLGGVRAFALAPRTGTWEETQDLAQNIFELESIKKRKVAIAAENAKVLILDNGKTLQSADKLARYLERELGVQASVLYEPKLNASSSPAMLIAANTLEKPYSFDEILKRLPLQKGNAIPRGIDPDTGYDFILIMDRHLAESFQNADEYYTLENALSEDFPPNLPE